MNQSDNVSERVTEQVKETLGRIMGTAPGQVTGALVRSAALMAVTGTLSVGRGASNLAREAVEGAVQAVGEIGGETRAFVRDAIIGVVEGTGRVVTVTAPAVREVVVGAVRGSRGASADVGEIGRVAVEGAIVGADSVGIDQAEAVSEAVEGAVVAVAEAGGDLADAARASVGGVVSGVNATGGDVVAATRNAARILVSQAATSERTDAEIASLAASAVTEAAQETGASRGDHAETVAAAATGAVEAAYQVNVAYGDRVRRSVVSSIEESGRLVTPDLEQRLIEIGERLSIELPRGRAAWRGRALVRAVRLLLDTGGMDLAASLAYFTILSFFPLVTLVIMVFAIFIDPVGIRVRLTETIVHYFPASSGLLQEAVNHLLEGSLAVGLIALAGIVLTSNGLFLAANRAVNKVFGTETRRTVSATITQLGIGTIVVVLFMMSVGLTALFQVAMSYGGAVAESVGGASTALVLLPGIISATLPAVLTGTVFTVVYYYLPNTPVEWKDAAFGGIIAVILFEVAKHLFFWFTNLATQRIVVYGPVASVVVLLTWAYLAGMIFLYGAALTKIAQDLRPKNVPQGRK